MSPTVSTPSPATATPSRRRTRFRLSRLAQALLLIAFWQVGDILSRTLHLPVPGAIVGLFLVLALLGTGWLRLGAVNDGAHWFVGEMLLFFVPPVLSVLDHPEFASWLGVKLLVAIVLGTTLVMAVTALTIELCHRLVPARVDGNR